MRYLLLVLLASVAIVACGNSEAPDCTSTAAEQALKDYLRDPGEYARADAKLQALLSAVEVTADNLRTKSQDTGLHQSQCVAHVQFKKGADAFSQDLPFSDHLPGDQHHVIDADLAPIRGKLEAMAQ